MKCEDLSQDSAIVVKEENEYLYHDGDINDIKDITDIIVKTW